MGLLDRILHRQKAPLDDRLQRRISDAPDISEEQARTNRELMEAQMAESREKRSQADE